jgi:hypothetical protein
MKLFSKGKADSLGSRSEVLAGKIPPALLEAAKVSGITEADCLASVRSDMDLEGRICAAWLIIGRDSLVVLGADRAPAQTLLSGPFKIKEVTKIRNFQTVGSMFLQVLIDGMYVDVVRFSNGFREVFGRVQSQVDGMLKGKPFDVPALSRKSETICQKCGLPLPGIKANCPRCAGSKGIFTRTLLLMKPYWLSIVALLGMMIVGVSLDLIPPQLTRFLVDRVLKPDDPSAAAGGVSAVQGGFQGFLQRLTSGQGGLSLDDRLGLLIIILVGLVLASALRHTFNVFIGRDSLVVLGTDRAPAQTLLSGQIKIKEVT